MGKAQEVCSACGLADCPSWLAMKNNKPLVVSVTAEPPRGSLDFSPAPLVVRDYGAEISRSAAMQEMDAQIKALESRIAELEAENKDPHTAKLLTRRVFGQDRDW